MTAPAPWPYRWARAMGAFNRYLSEDFLGGPRPFRMATVINLQKGGTLPFVAWLIWWSGTDKIAAYVYLGLHGSYGLCWLLKDAAFGDARWEKRVTIGGAVMSWLLVLGLYWLAPLVLITEILGPLPEPSGARIATAIVVHTLGVVVMMVADAQKHFTLKVRPGLITDGLFRFIRHPNYLGEMMVYGAYAYLVGHWLPWLVLAWVWSQVFLVNILNKEASLARHPGWPAYRARTGMLLPRLWRGG
jgi:protein-S-isoprenylcysteine O-methyltransferase Ste14